MLYEVKKTGSVGGAVDLQAYGQLNLVSLVNVIYLAAGWTLCNVKKLSKTWARRGGE